MERLTFTNEELKQLEIDCPVKNDYLVERFCDMVCDEFQGNCPYMKMAQKLKSYEDAEENGLLIHLPCRVGDTVYGLYWDDDYCASVKEYKFTLTFYEHCKDRFGETLFFTREAAEQALKQMGE